MTERDRQSSSEQTGRVGSPQPVGIDPVQSSSDFLSDQKKSIWQESLARFIYVPPVGYLRMYVDPAADLPDYSGPCDAVDEYWAEQLEKTRKAWHGSACHCVYCVEFE